MKETHSWKESILLQLFINHLGYENEFFPISPIQFFRYLLLWLLHYYIGLYKSTLDCPLLGNEVSSGELTLRHHYSSVTITVFFLDGISMAAKRGLCCRCNRLSTINIFTKLSWICVWYLCVFVCVCVCCSACCSCFSSTRGISPSSPRPAVWHWATE